MIKILFVCLGNICRSPLAEAIFNNKVKDLGLTEQLFGDSAGTSNYHVGDKPDNRTAQIATEHGVPIRHLGMQFNRAMADDFDYLIAMDASNLKNMIAELGGPSDKVILMRHFDPQAVHSDVPDPYYGGKEGFEEIYQILDRSMDKFIAHLVTKHQLVP